MKAESEILDIKGEKCRSKYDENDNEIMSEIAKHHSIHVQQKLQERWYNECKKQEKKSNDMWNTKLERFKQLETKDQENAENTQQPTS